MEEEDIKLLCRVCLQQPNEEDLLDLELIYDEEENLTYGECFTLCTNVILLNVDDGRPQNLCKTCGLELQITYDFIKKVKISEECLEKFLKHESAYAESTKNQASEVSILTNEDLMCGGYEFLDTTAKAIELEELVEYVQYETIDDKSSIIEANPIETDENEVENFEQYENQKEYDEYDEEENTSISWQTAVVTVANESHLPLNTTDGDQADLCERVYESDENTEDTITPGTTENVVYIEARESRKRGGGNIECTYCQKLFPNYSRMRQHRFSHETDRPKYPCSHCERIYATKQALVVHTKTVHTKTASYACSVCGKIYAIQKGLEVHMRYHTGNFPYECDLCDRKFAQVSHLNTHKNVKHNSERFACEHPNCGKSFTSSASLRSHEFSHSSMPFECEFCKRGYPAKAKLKVHLRRKHGCEMTLEEMERMRKFRVNRSKLNLVKVDKCKA